MQQPFAVHIPLQKSYERQLAFALGVRDTVTQRLITKGLSIKADNAVAPRVNGSGWHIWLMGADAKPTLIDINAKAAGLNNATVTVAVTATHDEVELSPLPSYPFPAGTTVYRSRLMDGTAGAAGALVQLEMKTSSNDWVAAGPISITNQIGEFAAVFRPPLPQLGDEGAPTKVPVRLSVERRLTGNSQVNKRLDAEFQLQVGLITTKSQVVDWLQLTQI